VAGSGNGWRLATACGVPYSGTSGASQADCHEIRICIRRTVGGQQGDFNHQPSREKSATFGHFGAPGLNIHLTELRLPAYRTATRSAAAPVWGRLGAFFHSTRAHGGSRQVWRPDPRRRSIR
jgi:hypothetical protein